MLNKSFDIFLWWWTALGCFYFARGTNTGPCTSSGHRSTMLSTSNSGEFNVLIQQNNGRQEVKLSTNCAKSWELSSENSSNEDGQWTALSIIQLNGFVLAARSQYNDETSVIYMSVNYGRTWSTLLEKSTHFKDTIHSISSSTSSTDYICVCSGRNIVVSNDHGLTWSVSLSLNPSAPALNDVVVKTSESGQYTYVLSFSQSPEAFNKPADSMMGRASIGAVHKSSDFGATWRVICKETFFSSTRGHSLWVSGDGKNVLFAGGGYRVLHSSNFGKSFENLLTNSDFQAVSSQDPATPTIIPSKVKGDGRGESTSLASTAENLGADFRFKSFSAFPDMIIVSAVTMSRNGLHLVIAAKSEADVNKGMPGHILMISHDSGQSWLKMVSPAVGDSAITHMTVGDEGKKIIGVLDDGNIVNISLFSHY